MLHANQVQGQGGQGPQVQVQARAQARSQSVRPPLPPPPPVPESEEELHALMAKRIELGNQLEGMTDRREELADQLSEATGPARPGLQERIDLLDSRSARIEREMLLIDDAIAAGIAKGLGVSAQEGTGTTVAVAENEIFAERVIGVMIGEAVAFLLLGIFLYRLGWRRARERFSGSAPNDPARMDQLQNAVDAIALEVERISEGQRYVTKVLNAGGQPDFAAGAGQEQEPVPVRRKGS